MVYDDINCGAPHRKGDRVLFHKTIFLTYNEAVEALKTKNLAPGEIAVARYYVGYNTDTVPPTHDAVRMIMAIGGATPHTGHDTFIFNDSFGGTNEDPDVDFSNYYTKEEIRNLFKEVNDKIESIEDDFVTTIDAYKALAKDVSVLTDDFNNFKDIIDSSIDKKIEDALEDFKPSISEEDLEDYAKTEDVSSLLATKVDISTYNSDVNDINNSLASKVDENYVSELINTTKTEIGAILSEYDGQFADISTRLDTIDAKLEQGGGTTGDVYTKTEVDERLATKVDNSVYNTKVAEFDGLISSINVSLGTKADASVVASKVDKEEGKGLSTNDFTTELKIKLEGINTGAEVNIVKEVDTEGVLILDASGKLSADLSIYTTSTDVGAAIDKAFDEEVKAMVDKTITDYKDASNNSFEEIVIERVETVINNIKADVVDGGEIILTIDNKN